MLLFLGRHPYQQVWMVFLGPRKLQPAWDRIMVNKSQLSISQYLHFHLPKASILTGTISHAKAPAFLAAIPRSKLCIA